MSLSNLAKMVTRPILHGRPIYLQKTTDLPSCGRVACHPTLVYAPTLTTMVAQAHVSSDYVGLQPMKEVAQAWTDDYKTTLIESFVEKVISTGYNGQHQLLTSAIDTLLFPKYVFVFVSTFCAIIFWCVRIYHVKGLGFGLIQWWGYFLETV